MTIWKRIKIWYQKWRVEQELQNARFAYRDCEQVELSNAAVKSLQDKS